jgi:hypothetical protein
MLKCVEDNKTVVILNNWALVYGNTSLAIGLYKSLKGILPARMMYR